MVNTLTASFVIGFLLNLLSASRTPITLSFAFKGTVTNSSRSMMMENSFFTFCFASGVLIIKGMPSMTVSAITPESSLTGIFIDFIAWLSLDFLRLSNWVSMLISSSSPILFFSIWAQILEASSALSGPMPILPSSRFSFSFTRKSMALLKLRPVWDVAAVSMI